MSLLVVGSVAFDSVSTPSGSVENVLGGSATYFSLSASHFCNVRLVAVVGQDFGPEHRQVFQGRPIDLQGLQTRAGDTFRWVGEYSQDLKQAHTLETHLNVFQEFDPTLPEEYRDSDLVFLGNIDPELQARVVDQVRAPRLVACDTMNFWITGKLESLRRTIAKVDVLVINDEEVQLLTGERAFVKGARQIIDWGPRVVVVKLGMYGVAMVSAGSVFFTPAYHVEEVVDPTGAGDTFAGGFMAYLTSQGSLEEPVLRRAVVYGAVMSSFVIESFSTRGLERLTPERLQERFRAFRNFTSYDEA